MLDTFKQTAKHTFIYSLGNLSVKLAGLILLPLFTTKLSTTEYGYLAIFETTGLFLNIFFSLNLAQSLMRWYADAKEKQAQKSVVATCIFFVFLNIILFNLILSPFVGRFSNIFFNTNQYSSLFLILFAYISIDVFNSLSLSLIRMLEKSKLFITINIAKLLIIFTFNIIFITKYSLGIKGILISSLIGSIFNFLVLLPLLIRNISSKIDFGIIKPMLKYAIPLSFTSLSTILLDSADRYILKFLTNDANVGIYSLAFKISGMLNFFLFQSFATAFLPIAYKIYKQENAKQIFSKTMTYLVMGLLFIGLGLALFSKEFLFIFSPKNQQYWQAASYVPLLNIIVVFYAMRFMYTVNFLIAKKNIYQPIFVITAVLINIGLNFLLIPKFEIWGAICSSIITSFILNVFYYIFSRKYYKVDYEMLKIWLLIATTIVFYVISLFFNFNIFVNAALKILLFALFPITLFFGGFFEKNEKQTIILMLKNIKNPNYWKNFMSKIVEK